MPSDPSWIPVGASVVRVRASAQARLAQNDNDLAAGRIDEREWYQAVSAVLSTAYLAFDDPIWQSGYHGTSEQWRQAREIVVAAIDRSGSFLDVGCANGLLMESVVAWSAEKGWAIEPYGLDISAELVGCARLRLPRWADRIFIGNAIDWAPPRRFDFVRTGLEYVPPTRRVDLVDRLLRQVVTPTGRLIIGPFHGGPADDDLRQVLGALDLTPSSEAESVSSDDKRRIVWIDRS